MGNGIPSLGRTWRCYIAPHDLQSRRQFQPVGDYAEASRNRADLLHGFYHLGKAYAGSAATRRLSPVKDSPETKPRRMATAGRVVRAQKQCRKLRKRFTEIAEDEYSSKQDSSSRGGMRRWPRQSCLGLEWIRSGRKRRMSKIAAVKQLLRVKSRTAPAS